jgi:hypothetical protein
VKPNANLYRLNAILDFTKSQQEFLEQVGFFNPEPQITASLANFPDIDKSNLTRLIAWQAVDNRGQITNRLFDLQPHPFRQTLKQLSQQLNETNFRELLRDPNTDLSSLVNFKILEVIWFIKLWENKNRWVPPYAPKRLNNGLKFVYTDNKLIVSFQKVWNDLWLTSDHNPTTVIPLTHENFDLVTSQHVHLAQKYLQDKENK